MEWLMVIFFILASIMDSKKKSDQAKQQRQQRMGGQEVYRSGDNKRPAPQPKKQEGNLFESLGDLLENLDDALEGTIEKLDQEIQPKKKAQPAQTGRQQQSRKQVADRQSERKPSSQMLKGQLERKESPVTGKTLMETAKRHKKHAEPQTAKKSSKELPTKTLMELRPDREQRDEHTKVSASVKPLKNAFENDESCEHRIELNPNIQYSKQQQKTAAQRTVAIKTDGESIVQGIIWAEILDKPKAYQNRARRVTR